MRILIVAVGLMLSACVAAPHPVSIQAHWVPVPLSESDPTQGQVGRLRFLGALDLQVDDPRFGGHSGMRWSQGRLFTILDNGRWTSFVPVERDGRLIAIDAVEIGDLLSLEGTPFTDKEQGDSEGLTIAKNGDWLVSFERNHRILRYRSFQERPQGTEFALGTIFGALANNNGVEVVAGDETNLLMCAEQNASDGPNCYEAGDGATLPIQLQTPPPLDQQGGLPTDADRASNGNRYVLFRSGTPFEAQGAAVVEMTPNGATQTIAVFQPPLAFDNMEGLAVREVANRVFVYLISDDNFSAAQRTLLMKFEVLPEE